MPKGEYKTNYDEAKRLSHLEGDPSILIKHINGLHEEALRYTPEDLTREKELRRIDAEQREIESQLQKKRFLRIFRRSKDICVPCRRFVFPRYNPLVCTIETTEGEEQSIVTMKKVFEYLDIDPAMLSEVYELGEKTEKGALSPFAGFFTENGKQKLTDILGKEITFFRTDCDARILSGSEEVFEPNVVE